MTILTGVNRVSYKCMFSVLLILVAVFLPVTVGAQTPEPGVACSPSTPCPTPVNALAVLSTSVVSDPVAQGQSLAALTSEPAQQTKSSGFGLAWAAMAILALALLYALVSAVMAALGKPPPVLPAGLSLMIPILSLVGLGIAIYLTYVETQNVAAVCGPVGDCNAVQASPFSKLFGFLPVGLLGAIGYVLILAGWGVNRFLPGRLAGLAPFAMFAMALFGVVFSMYLTYLELYIIRAVCIWCVSSAIVMSLVLVLTVGPAVDALYAE